MLKLAVAQEVPLGARQSASIFLKNVVKAVGEGQGWVFMNENDKATLRENIVEGLIHSHNLIV
jgi:hypothetical protein